MTGLLDEIGGYWTRRAASYSEEVNRERLAGNEKNWVAEMRKYLPPEPGSRILDVGTGPGFFATALAKLGYRMAAVDFAAAMLEQAKKNAGELVGAISFSQMDAQNLTFPDCSFDAVVSRDLTWNLEDPGRAYAQWYRVLRPGGVMLNFDAEWYSYLFQEDKRRNFAAARQKVTEGGLKDLNAYDDAPRMEEISRRLILSRLPRPQADVELLQKAGFTKISVDETVWERVWDPIQKANNGSTPCFLICVTK